MPRDFRLDPRCARLWLKSERPSGEVLETHQHSLNKDGSDFMLAEYSQIANAFFNLYGQLNEILRTYLTVMTAGSAALTFLFQVLPRLYPAASAVGTSLFLLGALLVVLGLLGVMAFFAFIGIRSEMLLYARTINGIRAYFEDHTTELHNYLVLPRDEFLPKFFEGPRTAFFWETLLIGTLNSIILAAGVLLLLGLQVTPSWGGELILLASGGTVAHAIAYWGFAEARGAAYKPHFVTVDAPAGSRELLPEPVAAPPPVIITERLLTRFVSLSAIFIAVASLASVELAQRYGAPWVAVPIIAIAVAGMFANVRYWFIKNPDRAKASPP